jgi:hypothetical protein
MDEMTLKKLEEAFAIGASDKEACFYADISHQTLYTYQQNHPEFVERKEALKERPVLLARQSVLKAMESDPATARWYLERKAKLEFASRHELTGADGRDLPAPIYGGISVQSDTTTEDTASV